MKLTRHELGQLYIGTAQRVAGAIARKYYGRPELIARFSQDAARSQIAEAKASANGKRTGK